MLGSALPVENIYKSHFNVWFMIYEFLKKNCIYSFFLLKQGKG